MVFADALLELKDPDNARRALEQGLQQTPDDLLLLLNGSVCLLNCGQKDRALELFHKYREMRRDVTYDDEVCIGSTPKFMNLF